MGRQFENVAGRHGSPMGRKTWGTVAECGPRSIRLYRVNIDSQGYDDGGAYWGIGEPLYCAQGENGDYRDFVRAQSRLSAVAALEIPCEKLKAPPLGDYKKLRALEHRGCISASGVLLRQKLQNLNFKD